MKKKNKGFTLIELLAVIVILAVMALIAMPIVLNLIEKARQGAFVRSAEGVLKASDLYYASSLLTPEGATEITFNCNGKKCVGVNKAGEDVTLDVDGTVGTGYVTITENGEVEMVLSDGSHYVSKSKNGDIVVEEGDGSEADLRLDGNVKLDSTSGNYTYPETRSFEVTENISGGALSCLSSDEEVATCSITGTTVTVVAGTKEGNATLTIKSSGNSKYKDAQTSYVVVTAKGLLTVNASDVTIVYDGQPHGITVTSEGATIKYGTIGGTYDLITSPTYTDAGEYTIYYEVSKSGYNTVVGSKKIIITKAEGNIEIEVPSEIQYDKTERLEIKSASDGNISVTSTDDTIVQALLVDGKLEITSKKVGKTTIIVSSSETNNYKVSSTTYEITVKEAENTLELSSTSGNYTYPETRNIEVKENTSEGILSCTSSDDAVATCTVTETTLTVVAGTKEGNATLTIKSEATENYNEATVVYLVNTVKGTLTTVNADGYSGVYDGKEHGITVTSEGATITYGTEENNYNLTESPKYKDVGVYTIYYKIEKSGYNEIKGSKQVEITKAENILELSSTSGSYVYPISGTFTIKTNTSEGKLSCASSDEAVATCSITDNMVTVIPGTTAGKVTLTIKSEATNNYNEASIIYSATISKGTLVIDAQGYEGSYDGLIHGITVTSEGATIKYGTSQGTYNLDASPTYINAGEYTVYYQVTREGYNTVSGSKIVKIIKVNSTLELSSTNGNYTYPETRDIEVKENTSEGKLSCSSSDEEVATCSITGTTVTVVAGTKEGTATLTIKSEITTNYNEAKTAYLVTTKKGTLTSVTANGYEGEYDGLAHGITVTSEGATIKYGTSQGTYNLDASPTYTDVGIYTVYYEITREGYNVITGEKQVIIKDTKGPVTTVVYKTEDGNIYESDTWTNQAVTAYITSTDEGTGIDYYQMSYEGSNWTDINEDSFTFDKFTGRTGIWFRAVDKAGNIGSLSSTYIIAIDKTVPTISDTKTYTTAKIYTDFASQIVLSGSQSVPTIGSNLLSLSTSKPYLVSFDYKTESGTNQFDVDLHPDSLPQIWPKATTTLQHYDWFTSSTNSDMTSSRLRFFDDIQEDDESDILISNIKLLELTEKNSTWYSTDVAIVINGANDDYAGIDDSAYDADIKPYSFDGGKTWHKSNAKIITSTQTVNIAVRDKAGNVYYHDPLEVKIDKIAPTIVADAYVYSSIANSDGYNDTGELVHSYSSNQEGEKLFDYNNTGINFRTSATDNDSGIESIMFYWDTAYQDTDPGKDFVENGTSYSKLNGTSGIDLQAQGYRRGRFVVTDNAGNQTLYHVAVPIDLTKPTISYNYPVQSIVDTYGGAYYMGCFNGGITPILTISDVGGSGLSTSISTGIWKDNTWPNNAVSIGNNQWNIPMMTEGKYIPHIAAKDNAGNWTDATRSSDGAHLTIWDIDTSAPTMSVNFNGYIPGNWTNGNIAISLSGSNTGCETTKNYYYSINDGSWVHFGTGDTATYNIVADANYKIKFLVTDGWDRWGTQTENYVILRDGTAPTISDIKTYTTTEISTGFTSDIVLLGSDTIPVKHTGVLNLSTTKEYLISFDYKTASGTNEFNVDLYPDTLPERRPTATTTLQHYDWITSSTNSDMESSRLRFFDNVQETNESDITISNIKLLELTEISNTNTLTLNSVIVINGATDNVELSNIPYSFDGGATWQKSSVKLAESSGTIKIAVRDSLGNIYYGNSYTVK